MPGSIIFLCVMFGIITYLYTGIHIADRSWRVFTKDIPATSLQAFLLFPFNYQRNRIADQSAFTFASWSDEWTDTRDGREDFYKIIVMLFWPIKIAWLVVGVPMFSLPVLVKLISRKVGAYVESRRALGPIATDSMTNLEKKVKVVEQKVNTLYEIRSELQAEVARRLEEASQVNNAVSDEAKLHVIDTSAA